MASLILVALVAFLAGAAAAVFLMLSIAIRKGDRPERILGSQDTRLGSCARSTLASGTWPNEPVYRDGRQSN
jgi:hypothetical protein